MEQMAFGFLQELEEKQGDVARIDGWPVLNYGHPGRSDYQSGWIHRRWYPSAEEVLLDACRASKLIPDRLYAAKYEIEASEIWPDGTYWAISLQPPYHGTTGAYYHKERDHYVVIGGVEIFCPGESDEVVQRKQQRVTEEWEQKMQKKRR